MPQLPLTALSPRALHWKVSGVLALTLALCACGQTPSASSAQPPAGSAVTSTEEAASAPSGVQTQAMPAGFTSVKTYGAKCDGVTDDSAAVQRALTSANNVYLPAGTCLVGNLLLRSNQNIVGEGSSSVLLQKVGAPYLLSANPGRTGTANVADNTRNIRLEKFKLRGQAGKVAFDEHIHLLNLNAVSDVVVSELTFEGYVGDGLYLGSGMRYAERHNERVKILNSVFDGVVQNNRNGITIVDGTDVEIRGSKFLRTGRPGMPGAIDLEPDPENDAFSRVRNITIDNCEFRDVAANALIALLLRPQDRLTTPSQNITISNVRGYGDNRPGQTALALTHSSWDAKEIPTASTVPLNLRVVNSSFDGVYRPFIFTQMKGAVIENTTFSNSRTFASIGDGDSSSFNRDIYLRGVTFNNVGYDVNVGYKALTIYSNDGVGLSNVTVKNGTGLGIAFSQGVSRNVTIRDTTITNDSGRLVYGIKRFSNHTLNVNTNTAVNIQLVGVKGNDFRDQ